MDEVDEVAYSNLQYLMNEVDFFLYDYFIGISRQEERITKNNAATKQCDDQRMLLLCVFKIIMPMSKINGMF